MMTDWTRAGFHLPGAVTILTAVNFDDRIETPGIAELPQPADLGQHLRQELLAAEPRIDSRCKDHIAEVEYVFDQLSRACRAEHHARLLAEVVDRERTRR